MVIPSNADALIQAVTQKGLTLSPAAWDALAPTLLADRAAIQGTTAWLAKRLGWSEARVEGLSIKEVGSLLAMLSSRKTMVTRPADQEPRDQDGQPRRRPADTDNAEEIDDEAVEADDVERKPVEKPAKPKPEAPATNATKPETCAPAMKAAPMSDADIAKGVVLGVATAAAAVVVGFGAACASMGERLRGQGN